MSLPRVRSQKVLTTISFNDPQVIEWQIRLVAEHIPHAIHIVADNSDDLAARTATVAAAVMTRPDGRWYLWPGFALFNLGRLTTTRLNFGKDWLDDLDTGGLNWSRVYCHLNEGELCKANSDRLPIADNIPFEEAYFERIDGWIHECGTTSAHIEPVCRRFLTELKRRHTIEILAKSDLGDKLETNSTNLAP